MLVSKNGLLGIGLVSIKAETLWQRFLQLAKSRQRAFATPVSSDLECALSGDDHFNLIA
ncbi:MAG: hypothetical protein ACKVQT_08575 [Burkholderiales bacterium]